jgi:hypothetical protein
MGGLGRLSALQQSRRPIVFDEFCKNVAAEQKALAAAAEKQAVDGFK